MITFRGTYFDGMNSAAHEVNVTVQGDRISLRGGSVQEDHHVESCSFEPALGSARRTLYTPTGGRLDTSDLHAFLALERLKDGTWRFRLVHLLESQWKIALVSVLVTFLAVVAVAVWGIPYLAEKAAFSLPDGALQSLGRGALASMDRHFFKPSELDAAETERVRLLVKAFAAETGAPEPRVLNFRKSPFGPNAFALPGDIVILTDELISFVDDDAEILGVVAHELAHLKNRHAVRTLFQGTGVFALVSFLMGDVTSITSAAGTLPAILLESRYSRGFERNADATASRWMDIAGYGAQPMIAFLNRVKEREKGFEGPEFLSTHPALDKRIDYLMTLDTGSSAQVDGPSQ